MRIEVFLPDLPDAVYPRLQNELENELSYTFNGCSVVTGIKGLFLSSRGKVVQDRINVLFTDVGLIFAEDYEVLEGYVDYLQQAILAQLVEEEQVLIAVHVIYHQEQG